MQAVLSIGSTLNSSKQEQFRPPGKLVHICMQSLESTHSLISYNNKIIRISIGLLVSLVVDLNC